MLRFYESEYLLMTPFSRPRQNVVAAGQATSLCRSALSRYTDAPVRRFLDEGFHAENRDLLGGIIWSVAQFGIKPGSAQSGRQAGSGPQTRRPLWARQALDHSPQ